MKAKAFTLRTQKTEFATKLTESQVTTAYLRRIQKEMETALQEKQNQINALMEKEAESIKENLRIATLTGLLKEKEAEIEEMKHQLMNPNSSKHNDENTSRNDTLNNNVTETEKHEDENTSRGDTLNGNATEADTHGDENTPRSNTLSDNAAEADKHEADATTQNASVEQLPNSEEGKEVPKEGQVGDANGIAGKEEETKPREGQWIKFITNAGDAKVNDEANINTDQNAKSMGKEQLEMIKDIHGGEQTREASEISQEGIDSEAKDRESKGRQVVNFKEVNLTEENKSKVHEDTDLERQEKSPDGNEQQTSPMEPNLVVEGNEPKMRHRHHRRNKTKGRKHRMTIMEEDGPETNSNGHSEDSEKNEGTKDESLNDKEGSVLNNNLPQMPDSSETIERQAESSQKDDKNASQDGINDGKSVMTSNSAYGEDASKSMQNGAISKSDESNNEAGRNMIDAKTESMGSTNQQLQNTQNLDETENSQKHEDDPNEIAKTEEQTEVASENGLSDAHDSSQENEDSMASSNTDDATVDLRKASNGITHDDSIKDALHNEGNQKQEDLPKQNNNDTTEF